MKNMLERHFKINFQLCYIHCDPLMLQQKEARRQHPCVLPACFLKKLAKQCEFPAKVVILVYYCNIKQQYRRKHAGSTQVAPIILLRQNGELTPKRQLFQEAHMGASCVLPSVASLTGRSVYGLTYGKYFPASPWYSNVISSINNRWSDRQTFRSLAIFLPRLRSFKKYLGRL